MLRILTDNHYFAVSLDDLALFTDRLYGSSYFHFFLLAGTNHTDGAPPSNESDHAKSARPFQALFWAPRPPGAFPHRARTEMRPPPSGLDAGALSCDR